MTDQSPFYPEQSLPEEWFTGRDRERELLEERGLRQVEAGREQAFFIEAPSGLGKTSLARYVMHLGSVRYNLVPLYAPLGAVADPGALGQVVLGAAADSAGLWRELARTLSRYIRSVSLLGFVDVDLTAIREDAEHLTTPAGMLGFLRSVVAGAGARGVCLVLDELGGVATQSWLPALLKSLWEANAATPTPLALLLLVCGAGERRREMRRLHPSAAGILHPVSLGPLERNESMRVLESGFERAGLSLVPGAISELVRLGRGHPRVVQLLGSSCYWRARGGTVDSVTIRHARRRAVTELAELFLDPEAVRVAAEHPAESRALGEELAGHPLRAPLESDETRPAMKVYLERLREVSAATRPESGGAVMLDSLFDVYLSLGAADNRPAEG